MRVKKKSKIYKFGGNKNSSSNPFKDEKKQNKLLHKFGFIIIIISLFFTFKIIFFHNFFQVKFVHISGIQRIEEQEIQDAVYGIMDYKKFFVIPANNYFLVNVREIRDILTSRFPIKSIVVEKNFPNKIYITIEEKISTIIYDNGENYAYIGLDGRVVEIIRRVEEEAWLVKTELTTSTDMFGEVVEEEKEVSREHVLNSLDIQREMGDYPIIYDKRGLEALINQNVLKKETVQSVVEWYSLINEHTDVIFEYVELENELGSATIKTKEGWDLYVSLERSTETQYHQLVVLLEEKIKDKTNLNYIDLRYKERAYWK